MANNIRIRSQIEDHFKKNNVAMTGYVYKVPLNKQPRIINNTLYLNRELPNTEKFSDCHFTPPNYPELSDENVKYACSVLNSFSSG